MEEKDEKEEIKEIKEKKKEEIKEEKKEEIKEEKKEEIKKEIKKEIKEEIKKENNNIINENENIIKDKNYYKEKVKVFMNINLKDPDYLNIIEKNSDSLFKYVDENTISNWENILQNEELLNIDDQINSVEKDTSFQKVIQNDCNRTRVRESILLENFKGTLENILTYYCKTKNVYYKQGLNEIYGPLLLIKYKYKQLTLSKIFSLGEALIDQFLPNYFYEKELYSLKSALGLLLILIRYHEPSVYNRLDSMEIIPEMYATNWVMTYSVGKLKLDIVYNLWNYIITINDPLFLHFYFVALIINNRELIINCDKPLLPTLISSLTITSNEELNSVIEKAKELRKQTPYSFRILADNLGFLICKNKNVKKNFEKYKPLSLPAMPIFPLEVFYITNHSEIDCPDEYCKNCRKIRNQNNLGFVVVDKLENYNKNYKCEKCQLKIEKNMKFFLLDLRILEYGLNKEENESDKTGYLPLMINVDQDELKSEEINDIISKRYINERGLFHFIFLTTSTDAFLTFEEKFYKINISEEDEKKIMFGLMEKKAEKELNFDSEKISKKQIFKLKEYDNLKKILKGLQKQNYPYVGFVYGGFDLLHKKSIEYNIELLFHNEKTCILCNEKRKNIQKGKKDNKEQKEEKKELYNQLWEHKKKIKYQNLNEAFKNPKTTSIYFGTLINYKNKKLGSEKIQLLIVLKKSEFKIELYKFLKNDIELISKSGYYGLGIDDERKDIELILIEEIRVIDVLGLNVDKKPRNVIKFLIRNYEDDTDKKKDNKIMPSFEIIIDFSSNNDSKDFIHKFKDMSEEFKKKLKKKKKNK